MSRTDSYVYRVVVTVRDQLGAASQTPVFLVEVDNILPSSLQTSLSSSVVNEGQTITLNGSFIDPGVRDTHLVYIDWGDGTAKQKVPLAQIIRTGTTRNYSLTHTYLDNPLTGTQYTITAEVADDDEPLNPATTTRLVTVNNVLPTFTGNALVLSANETTEGGSIALNVSFVDPGREQHTLIVDWGDGTAATTMTMAPGATTAAGLLHQYVNAASNSTVYTIRATVLDRDTLLAAANSSTKPVAILNVARSCCRQH